MRLGLLVYGDNCMNLTSTVFDWSTSVTDRRTGGRKVVKIVIRNLQFNHRLCCQTVCHYEYKYFGTCNWVQICRLLQRCLSDKITAVIVHRTFLSIFWGIWYEIRVWLVLFIPIQSGTGGFHSPWWLQIVKIDVVLLLSRWPTGHVTLTTDHRRVYRFVSIDKLTTRNNSGKQVTAASRNYYYY